MSKEPGALYDAIDNGYKKWGLITGNPFSQGPDPSDPSHIQKVFTGRTDELKEMFSELRSDTRQRIFVYGQKGIGKTAFLLETLGVLQHKEGKTRWSRFLSFLKLHRIVGAKSTLIAYINLPSNANLSTAALIALAREMPDDPYARHLLHLMGIPTEHIAVGKKGTLDLPFYKLEEETVAANMPKFPYLSFEALLNKALEKYKRVIIVIDDLDKRDPGDLRQLLHDAQDMLKGSAWFIVTGPEAGLPRDDKTSKLGLFDHPIELEPLTDETMYRMLINYLNSARDKRDRYDDREDERSVRPFTQEAARVLCERSKGVPRWLNLLAGYVLVRATILDPAPDIINTEILQAGFEYANEQKRNHPGLIPEDIYLLNVALKKGVLSEANITYEELKQVKADEFELVKPILEKLVEHDLLQRLPSEGAAEYTPTPLVIEKPPEGGEDTPTDQDREA